MSKPGNTQAVRLDAGEAQRSTKADDDVHWRLTDHDHRPGRQPVLRYVGQVRRGRMVPAVEDDRDLVFVLRELIEGRALLAEAHNIQNRKLRRAAIAAAVGRLALGGRMLDDLVARRAGGLACDCVEVVP